MNSSVGTQTEYRQHRPEASPEMTRQNQANNSIERIIKQAPRAAHGRRSLLGAMLQSAWEAIWASRMRSLLTMFGIIIGVASVVGSLSMTQGVSNAIADYTVQSGGALQITLSGMATATTQSQRSKIKRQDHPSITLQDIQDLQRLPHVAAISPTIFLNEPAVYGDQKWMTRIIGVNPQFIDIENYTLNNGNWISDTQNTSGEAVAVIGDTVAKKLFSVSGEDPIGKSIRIRGQLVRVVGVLAPKGVDSFDNIIAVPFRMVQVRLTDDFYFNDAILSVDDISNIDLVVDEITSSLKRSHHIGENDPPDFTTITSAQILQQINQTLGILGVLFAGIAAISLVMGGIVIMNIMLVSVTERKQEIGIRMALGARRRDILSQFLSEALVLCLMGGGIGMLIGSLIGWEMSNVIIAALGSSNHIAPFTISLPTLLIPFLVSLIIGVVFGIYPAIRASHLEPITAIREPST